MQSIAIQDGEIIVNACRVLSQNDGVALIVIDLGSKYASIDSTGEVDCVCEVVLLADEHTKGIDRDKRCVPTVIAFPGFPGHYVFASQVNRYTLSVALASKAIEEAAKLEGLPY